MIYTVDGNIVAIDGNLVERKVKNLTFQIRGSWFPMSFRNNANDTNINSNSEYFRFYSTSPNSVTIDYGDGTIVVKEFTFENGQYHAGFSFRSLDAGKSWLIPQHVYTDGFDGVRNISFEFSNPESIFELNSTQIQLRQALPIELNYFQNMKIINVNYAQYITEIPESFPRDLEQYIISNSPAVKLPKLPDALFETKISVLGINSAVDLSDRISSNFFKINQLSGTLTNFSANTCDITRFPSSISECILLEVIRASGSLLTEFPLQILNLSDLKILEIGNLSSAPLTDNSIPILGNFQKIESLVLVFRDLNLADIPESFRFLYSLKNLGASAQFNIFINTSARFDEFIGYFYTLITENGSITSNGSPSPYPNRFRNISWGTATLSFTGAKVAPSGYAQGVSNGTPTTSGQRAYVLQNQYNHTITHGTPL